MFGLTAIPWRLLGALAVAAAIAGVLFAEYFTGYHKGEAAEVAHYEPLMQASREALAAANARAAEQAAAAAQITRTLEDQHAKDDQALTARAAAAQLAVVRVLRDYAEHPAAGGQPVRTVPAAADHGPPAGEGHDPPAAAGPQSRLAVDAAQCEHDADELLLWIGWYNQQRQLYTSSAK